MTKRLKFNEPYSRKGYWWLPSDSDKKIAGIISYKPNEFLELELFGALNSKGDPFLDVMQDFEMYPIIHGQTELGEKISLLHCHRRSGCSNGGCDFALMRYGCEYLLEGEYLSDKDQASFYKADFVIPELLPFRNPDLLGHIYTEGRTTLKAIEIKDNSRTISTVNLNDGSTVELMEWVPYSGTAISFDFSQENILIIRNDEDHGIKDYVRKIEKLEQFFSLASLKIAQISTLTLYDRKNERNMVMYKNGQPIHVLYVQDYPIEPAKDSVRYLFSYRDVEKIFQSMLKLWMEMDSRANPIVENFYESLGYGKKFTHLQFLQVMQAVEGYWWRYCDDYYVRKKKIASGKRKVKKTTLEEIVSELINRYCSIDVIQQHNDKDWIKSIVDSRNYYSHTLKSHSKKNIKSGLELFGLMTYLRRLLICILLHKIRVTIHDIRIIVSNCHSLLMRDDGI